MSGTGPDRPTGRVGRPRRITPEDIIRVGRELGLEQLSLNAVAQRLDVTATALYRHVDGRWGLEAAVGEDLLREFPAPEDPDADVATHLTDFAMTLWRFSIDRPGMAHYLQTLFPRGPVGRDLLATQVTSLTARGHLPETAFLLVNSVANLVIGLAAADELRRSHADSLVDARQAAVDTLRDDATLAAARTGIPSLNAEARTRVAMVATVRGLTEVAPPGTSATEVFAALS